LRDTLPASITVGRVHELSSVDEDVDAAEAGGARAG
jgi:hypothetical protein